MEVRVGATLNRSETVARLRLEVAQQEVGEGLLSVTFPAVKGILPLTQNAKDDVILNTKRLGWERPSPLRSGNVVDTRYPFGMQFSAIVADGRGLYFAEEDPEANRKNLTWSPQQQEGTLDFIITHPVLGWGGPELVKDYTSPGDIVIGPFAGDWYDAARLYRKWALTAPWCAKGPIYQRKHYPQWFANVPYWTTSYFPCEYYIEEQINICEATCRCLSPRFIAGRTPRTPMTALRRCSRPNWAQRALNKP